MRKEQTEWIGVELAAKAAAPNGAEETVLPGGYLVRRESWQDSRIADPTGRRLAVVVDRSYSMRAVRDELHACLEESVRIGRDNDVDVYFTSAATRGEPGLRVDDPASALGKPLLLFMERKLSAFLPVKAKGRFSGGEPRKLEPGTGSCLQGRIGSTIARS